MIAKVIEAEREKFEGLVAELQAAAAETSDGPPTIPTLVEQLCQATGKKKLKAAWLSSTPRKLDRVDIDPRPAVVA
jgi:hypothetical protein